MTTFTARGVIPPLVVPFTPSGKIDEEAFKKEVQLLCASGIGGISSGGSTGEGAMLTDAELNRCLELIMENKPKDMPVLAGIIRNATRDVVQLGRDARSIGVDALLVTPVSYYGATAKGNYEFYREISEQVELPILIYNSIPNNQITPEDYVSLLDIDGVVGIKQVDPVRLSEMAALTSERDDLIFTACDQLLYSTYVAGACGAISALATVAPELCVAQWNAFLQKDQDRAKEIQRKLVPIVRTYLSRPYPGKVKSLLNLQGREVGVALSPNSMPSAEEHEQMRLALTGAGIKVRN